MLASCCRVVGAVVVKFREAGGSLDDQGWTAKVGVLVVPAIHDCLTSTR